jgi:hypothetical protein
MIGKGLVELEPPIVSAYWPRPKGRASTGRCKAPHRHYVRMAPHKDEVGYQ